MHNISSALPYSDSEDDFAESFCLFRKQINCRTLFPAPPPPKKKQPENQITQHTLTEFKKKK